MTPSQIVSFRHHLNGFILISASNVIIESFHLTLHPFICFKITLKGFHCNCKNKKKLFIFLLDVNMLMSFGKL